VRTSPASVGGGTLTTAGLVAVIGALVFGILGMHGLSQHGATPAPSTPGSIAVVAGDPHAAHPAPDHKPVAVETSAAAVADSADSASAAAADNHPGVASDMVMLCAAMILAAAAGVLLALRLLRVPFRAPSSLRLLMRVPELAATARAGTGPPPAWEFSVVRC
jgi:hypothetical protein